MKKIVIVIISISLLIILSIIEYNLYINYNINQKQVPILVYHNIVQTKSEHYQNEDTMTLEEFEEQMKYLKDNGYTSITADEFYEWKENRKSIPDKSILITFDDGFYSFKYLVQDILQKYDFYAICFLIGEVTGEETPEYDETKYGTIGLNDVQNHIKNVQYGSHTYGLHKLNEEGEKFINIKNKEEIKKDIEAFDTNLFKAEFLAYPYYTYTKDMIQELKKYDYKLAFAGEEEMATKKVNNYKIPRISGVKSIEEFKEIFESNKYKNKFGNGLLRKVFKRLRFLNF